VASLTIEKRLLHYFLAMGARETETNQAKQEELSLELDGQRVQVVILPSEALTDRTKIIHCIMRLSSLRNSFSRVYLAAPTLLGTLMDSEVFRCYGIGLVLFDERRIDETVRPQALQAFDTPLMSTSADPRVLSELASIKSMYMEMDRNISELREQLKTLQQNRVLVSRSHMETTEPPMQQVLLRNGVNLPSFFKSNPWLDVLSRRGRDGDEPLAS